MLSILVATIATTALSHQKEMDPCKHKITSKVLKKKLRRRSLSSAVFINLLTKRVASRLSEQQVKVFPLFLQALMLEAIQVIVKTFCVRLSLVSLKAILEVRRL